MLAEVPEKDKGNGGSGSGSGDPLLGNDSVAPAEIVGGPQQTEEVDSDDEEEEEGEGRAGRRGEAGEEEEEEEKAANEKKRSITRILRNDFEEAAGDLNHAITPTPQENKVVEGEKEGLAKRKHDGVGGHRRLILRKKHNRVVGQPLLSELQVDKSEPEEESKAVEVAMHCALNHLTNHRCCPQAQAVLAKLAGASWCVRWAVRCASKDEVRLYQLLDSSAQAVCLCCNL